MRALKFQVEISESNQIVVDLPAGIAKGRAELILLTADDEVNANEMSPDQAWEAHIVRALALPATRTTAEIEAELSAERATWD